SEPPPTDPGVQHLADRFVTSSGDAVVPFREALGSIGMEAVEVSGGSEIVARVVVPEAGALRLSVAAVGPAGSARAQVAVRSAGTESPLMEADLGDERSVWSVSHVDLARYAGREVEIVLRADADPAVRVLWGSPVLTGVRGARANVVVYEIDTLRADALGTYGFPGPSSPWIGALAREGALFAYCTSPASWTRPAAVSIQTSLSPPTHGVLREKLRLPEEVETLADVLRDEGWYTVAFQTNPNAGRPAGLDQGFDLVIEMNALIRHMQLKMEAWEGTRQISSGSASGTSELIAFLLEDLLPDWNDLPVYLYLHPNDPHAPYDPRGPFDRVPDLGRPFAEDRVQRPLESYGQDVRAADYWLGEIVRMLRQRGEFDRTAFALVSDHGEEFRDHGRMGHGINLYEETLRVPFLVRAPWAVPAGTVRRDRVSSLDVMPTLLDLVGVPVPEGAEGRSLLPALEAGGAGEEFADEAHYAHVITMKLRMEDEVVLDPAVVGTLAVLRGPWKCVVSDYGTHRPDRIRLYNLREDPAEREDVADQHPDVAAALAAEARAWWDERRTGQEADAGELDPEFEEQLRALGYLE
ncbi:MAG: sulfatase, partial [Gemmatimonadetes bacterium]|nr:sulfatase [Gemmatimonadota bacterium]